MQKWLDNAVFYEIYPQSFRDSKADGNGDIPGIIEKLDYIRELGCNAIWLNPCFQTPFGDAGYACRTTAGLPPATAPTRIQSACSRRSITGKCTFCWT